MVLVPTALLPVGLPPAGKQEPKAFCSNPLPQTAVCCSESLSFSKESLRTNPKCCNPSVCLSLLCFCIQFLQGKQFCRMQDAVQVLKKPPGGIAR